MQITKDLGQIIIERLNHIVDVRINIINREGLIVASSDATRIDSFHDGAKEVLKTKSPLIITDENLFRFPKSKIGINLPIVFSNETIGVVGVSGDPEKNLNLTELIKMTVELLIEQLHIERTVKFKERLWGSWLYHLLHPNGMMPEKLNEEARLSFGVEMERDWRLIILKGAEIHNYSNTIKQCLQQEEIDYLFLLPYQTDEIIIILRAEVKLSVKKMSHLKRQVPTPFIIAFSDIKRGVIGLRTAHQELEKILLLNNNEREITGTEEWELELLINSVSKEKYESICSKYENKLRTLNKQYIETLEMYISYNGNMKETAESLNIHRNTLQYRLNKIREKVGLDPFSITDGFILYIILRHTIYVQMHKK